jgi:hypothetical protein
VVASTPATEEIGAKGREIEPRHGIGRVVALKKSVYVCRYQLVLEKK